MIFSICRKLLTHIHFQNAAECIQVMRYQVVRSVAFGEILFSVKFSNTLIREYSLECLTLEHHTVVALNLIVCCTVKQIIEPRH